MSQWWGFSKQYLFSKIVGAWNPLHMPFVIWCSRYVSLRDNVFFLVKQFRSKDTAICNLWDKGRSSLHVIRNKTAGFLSQKCKLIPFLVNRIKICFFLIYSYFSTLFNILRGLMNKNNLIKIKINKNILKARI